MTLDRGRPADGQRSGGCWRSASACSPGWSRSPRRAWCRWCRATCRTWPRSSGSRSSPGRRPHRREGCRGPHGAAAGRRGRGAVRRRVHRGVRARHRRGAGHDDDADHQSASAATHRRGDHDRDGSGVRRASSRRCSATPGSRRASSPRSAARRCSARCSRWAGRRASGPTLTGVIAVASATEGANVARGVALVIAYCLGLGIPFVLLAFGSARAVQGLGWLRRAHPGASRSSAACC